MWYARGEWELMLDCFRKTLFYHREHSSTLVNLISQLLQLGFPRDARAVMRYYDSIGYGDKGWTPRQEAALREAIARDVAEADAAGVDPFNASQIQERVAARRALSLVDASEAAPEAAGASVDVEALLERARARASRDRHAWWTWAVAAAAIGGVVLWWRRAVVAAGQRARKVRSK